MGCISRSLRISLSLFPKRVHSHPLSLSLSLTLSLPLSPFLLILQQSEDLKIPFQFDGVAQFRFEPSSGVLLPTEETTITLVFAPRQLGRFSLKSRLSIGRGRKSFDISVFGKSFNRGDKRQLIGGTDKLPEDFEKSTPFEGGKEDTSLFTRSSSKGKGKNYVPRRDRYKEMIAREGPRISTNYAFTATEIQEQLAHRQTYDSVITRKREAREAAAIKHKDLDVMGKTSYPSKKLFKVWKGAHGLKDQIGVDPTDDIAMGLEFASGLESPKPPLPEGREPLYLKYSMAGYKGATDGVKSSGEVRLNPDQLITKKYKKKPSTQAEMKDCQVELTKKELRLIKVGPRLLEFGTVCVQSRTVKNFSVHNPLDKHILVTINCEQKEFSQSRPRAQVIPPGATAGFDIVFTSPTPNDFRSTLYYTINEKHSFHFACTADVVPMALSLPTNEIEFRFGPSDESFSLSHTLELKNPFTAPVEYWWTKETDTFSITPTKGTVDPMGSVKAQIVFAPTQAVKKIKDEFTLCVAGGIKQKVLCSGSLAETSCVLSTKQVDFGMVAVGSQVQKSIVIKNKGKARTVVQVTECPPGVEISPDRRVIDAGGKAELKLTFSSVSIGEFEGNIQFDYRGMGPKAKPLSLQVLGNSVVPDVRIEETEFDFGGVTIGSMETKTITLVNDGTVSGRLSLDMTRYPQFIIKLPEDKTKAYFTDLAHTEENGGRHFNIKIPMLSRASFELTFVPSGEHEHSFELPLVLKGTDVHTPIRRLIAGRGVASRILIHPPLTDFGERVILSKQRAQRKPYREFVTIRNDKDEELEWFAEVSFGLAPDDDASSFYSGANLSRPSSAAPTTLSIATEQLIAEAFRIEPSGGVLKPNEEMRVAIKFSPTIAVAFAASLDVFLDGVTSGKPYISTSICGSGTHPKLTFDLEEVNFGEAPVGVTITRTVVVRNDGYEHLELEYRLPDEMQAVPVQLSFPQGNILSLQQAEIPVVLSFKPTKSFSFSTSIHFVDSHGHSFSLPIKGSADSCLLTTQKYMDANEGQFKIRGGTGGNPVIISAIVPDSPRSSVVEEEDGEDEFERQVLLEEKERKGLVSLVRFLQASQLLASAHMVDKRASTEAIVATLTKDSGVHVWNMIEAVSGKKIKAPSTISLKLESEIEAAAANNTSSPTEGKKSGSGARPTSAMSSRSSMSGVSKGTRSASAAGTKAAFRRYLKCEEMLNFLKKHGALLSDISAELYLTVKEYSQLLDRQEYNHNLFADLTPTEANATKDRLVSAFHYKSCQAWVKTLYQIVKVFVLSKVSPKTFKKLPGMPASTTKINPDLAASNLHSLPEGIILQWLAYHYNKHHPHAPRPLHLFEHLRDGAAIASLLGSHLPELESVLGEVDFSCPLGEEQADHNAEIVIEAMKRCGMEYPMTGEYITHGSPRDLMLLCTFLYQNLPGFIPKTTITFTGDLHEQITQTVELSNPSKKPINYAVTLTGSPNFTVEATTVRLEGKGNPGSSVALPVQYKSRFTSPEEGRLMLVSSKDGTANAGTLVFKLRSEVKNAPALSTKEASAQLYQHIRIPVPVKNPFPSDAAFSVELTQQLPIRSVPKSVIESGAFIGSTAANGKKDGGASGSSAAARSKKKKGKKVELRPVPEASNLPKAFFNSKDAVKMRAEADTVMELDFVALLPGEHTASLRFFDASVGEFSVDIKVEVSEPKPSEEISFTCEETDHVSKTISLSFGNETRAEAVSAIVERINHLTPKKQKTYEGARDREIFDSLDRLDTVYHIECSSPFFSVPELIGVVKNVEETSNPGPSGNLSSERSPSREHGSGSSAAHRSSMSNYLTFSLDFVPRGPGVYKAQVVVQSKFDIRVVDIKAHVMSEVVTSYLSFQTHALQTVAQGLPIVNNTEEDWPFRATLSGSKFFSGPIDFVVSAHTTRDYPLSFSPDWVCDAVQGGLVLFNSRTGERSEFEFTGTADEPLAEEQVSLECVARESVSHTFKLRNKRTVDMVYSIESDLPNVSGASSIKVKANQSAEYTLSMKPKQTGIYRGSVSFVSQDGRFVWYAIELKASRPEPEASINITAEVRKVTAVGISVTNPLSEELRFDVSIIGTGLVGDQYLTLGPNESKEYQLRFSPLSHCDEAGSISFSNERVGEFWYSLQLHADPVAPVQLEDMECPLGQSVIQYVCLDNVCDQPILYNGYSSNLSAFVIEPSTIEVLPQSSVEVAVKFTANTIQGELSSVLTFEAASLGVQEYHVKGRGTAPTPAEETELFAPVNARSSSSIQFTNPTNSTLKCSVRLIDETNQFELFVPRSKRNFSVGPYDSTSLPFCFRPTLLSMARATVLIEGVEAGSSSSQKHLEWAFPVRGIAEAAASSQNFTFNCRARESFTEEVSLVVEGLVPTGRSEQFEIDVITEKKAEQAFLDRCISISLHNPVADSSDYTARASLVFEPLKPVDIEATIILSKKSGGRWRFPARFFASPADVDDTICVEAPLSQTASVTFKITNLFDEEAEYTAAFTVNSPPEFKVSPSKGTLGPFQSEGTSLTVSFTCREYSAKPKVGQLVIQTEDIQWVYEIHGSHPHYTKPDKGNLLPTLDNRLSPKTISVLKQTRSRISTRNHVASNKRAAGRSTVNTPRSPTRKSPTGRRSPTSPSSPSRTGTGIGLGQSLPLPYLDTVRKMKRSGRSST